jgi:hypothetical protein
MGVEGIPISHKEEVGEMSERFTGTVEIVDSQGRQVFKFDSSFAVLDLGGLGNEGDLRLRGDDGQNKIHLDGGQQLINVTNAAGTTVFRFDAGNSLLDLGPSLPGGAGNGNEADLRIWGDDGQVKIHLDGGTGDIKLSGADCAEDFEVEEQEALEPGSVMAIADDGKLRRCAQAYDRRVAGVISGAGSYKPGIILGRQQGSARGNRIPLALSGRVHCRVDANYGPVGVGDLLTTSPTVGHAMRAEDPSRAFGATIGKALRPVGRGTGLVPILIALQ